MQSKLLFMALGLIGIGVVANFAITATAGPAQSRPVVYDYTVASKIPHDINAFTQGLFVEDGAFYESTGQFGASQLRRLDLETGDVDQQTALPREVFGEGSAIIEGKILTLSWRAGRAFVSDPLTFERVGEFSYSGEGWGLTSNGEHLIVSDGTSTLRFVDADDFSVVETRQVTFNGRPLPRLNELEWINGEIFANVWQTNMIARIDPASGNVVGIIDLRGLLAPDEKLPGHTDVLNGIAFDKARDKLFVTGKYWPWIYEIELHARPVAKTPPQ